MSIAEAMSGARVVRSGIDYRVAADLPTILALQADEDAMGDGPRFGIEVLDGGKLRKKGVIRDVVASRATVEVEPQVEPGYESRAAAPVGTGLPGRAASVAPAPSASVAEPERPFYYNFGEWLMWRSPRLFRMLQGGRRRLTGAQRPFGGRARRPDQPSLRQRAPLAFRLGQLGQWTLKAVWQYKAGAALVIILCAALIALPFSHRTAWEWRVAGWLAATFVIILAVSGVVLREAFRRVIAAQDAAVANATSMARRAAERSAVQTTRHLTGLETRLADATAAIAAMKATLRQPAEEARRADLAAAATAADHFRMAARLGEDTVLLAERLRRQAGEREGLGTHSESRQASLETVAQGAHLPNATGGGEDR